MGRSSSTIRHGQATFTAGNGGSHKFSGLVLRTEGVHTVAVTDTANPSLSGTDVALVFEPEARGKPIPSVPEPGVRRSPAPR